MSDLAHTIFNGSKKRQAKAVAELSELLKSAGAQFAHLGFDDYDMSVELYDVPPDHRLPPAARAVIYEAGFVQAYVNHTDKWETHYSPHNPDGWRVSYPDKRGDNEEGIWVEAHVETWPQDWFDTGYVIIKPIAPTQEGDGTP